jgi:cytochrome c biogenesis protein
MTAQLGNTGNLPLAPGQSSNLIFDSAYKLDKVQEVTKQLPFEVTFTDIQQKLIRDDGSLSPANTIDWMTWFKIKDESGEHDAFVQMNRPYDYRGYRFFQSSFTPIGRARNITIVATPAAGGEPQTLSIPRDGSAELADGTKLVFKEFRGNYRAGLEDPNENTSTYENPAAVLEVVPREGVMQQAVAFSPAVGDIPIAKKPVNGYTFKMTAFEKVGESHVLSVQRDPGANVVYAGFALLTLTLAGTFAFSHRRVWAAVEAGPADTHEVLLAGNTNRNPNGFQERFKRLENSIVDSMKESN